MKMRLLAAGVVLVGVSGCVEEQPHYYHHHDVVYVQPAPPPPQPVYVAPQPVYGPPPQPVQPQPVYAPPPPQPVAVYQAAPGPQFVEEGTVYGGVVVAPVGVNEYVFVNGGYFYWHPQLHVWVHAHPGRDWHPGPNVRIYHSWQEHPEYRQHH